MCSSDLFDRDGSHIITASRDNSAKIWDCRTVKPILSLNSPTNGLHLFPSIYGTFEFRGLSACALSHDQETLVTAGTDKIARMWDRKTGMLRTTLIGHKADIMVAAFSPNDQTLVTGSNDGNVGIWDTQTGRNLRMIKTRLSGRFAVWALAFSPDGHRLVVGAYNAIKVFETATWTETLSMEGHKYLVMGLAFSPDGSKIVSADYDKTARVWNAKTGKSLLVLSGHKDPVLGVAYSLRQIG